MNRRGASRTCGALAIASLLTTASPAAAQLTARPILRLPGAQPADFAGATVGPAGDVNGDGFDDFLYAATNSDFTFADAGRAYLLFGGTRLDSVPDVVVTGRTGGGHAGEMLADVGDVNDDGFDDWLVGSPDYDTGASPRFPGKAWLFFGGASPNAVIDRTYDRPVPSTSAALFGVAMTGLGDFNADGYPDFLISGLIVQPESLSAYVYYGGPNLDQSANLNLRTGTGSYVRSASAGDINGDGWPDIVTGVLGQSSGVRGRLLVFHGGPGLDANPDVDILSEGVGDNFAQAVASGGDLNGDGYDDIVVGAMNRQVNGLNFAGEALVYFGGPTLDATPDLAVQGAALNDNLGASVALAGDLDGDGYADLVVGAPRADGRGIDSGRAYVCFGGPAMDAIPDLVIEGEAAADLFGTAVGFAGDPDLGGSDALLVGATQSDAGATNGGCAYLFRVARFEIVRPRAAERWPAGGTAVVEWRGADPATIELSLDDGAHWHTLASGVGGSSANAVEVAVPDATSGRARLRLTRTGSAPGAGASTLSAGLFHVAPAAPATAAVLGEPAEAAPDLPGRLGSAVATGVDWNGDGHPDVVAGAPYAGDGAIAIRPEPGKSGDTRVRLGATPLERFGAAVVNAGDLDGDGWNDLAVGAPLCEAAGPEAGRVYVFRGGPASDGEPDWMLEGQRSRELFGSALAAAGDLDGDGFGDLAIGAPGVSGEGRAYVYLGGPGFGPVPDRVLASGLPGPFGLTLAGAGDVNGDGADDLLVSGPPSPGGSGSSAVHLYFGSAAAASWDHLAFEGDQPGDGFGASMAGLGDLEGDGFDDFAIGAPFADVPGAGVDAGRVRIYYGTARFLPVAGSTLAGTGPGDFFGAALAGGADLNADGRPDLAIGAPGSEAAGPAAGRVDIYFGGSDEARDRVEHGEPNSRLGEALALRDVGADSLFAVLAAGAPFAVAPGGAGAEGRVRTLAATRWRFVEPAGAVEWLAGSRQRVRWEGAEAADLWFVGAGGSAERLAAAAGGAESNSIEVTLAASLADSGRLELRPAIPGPPGRAIGPPVHLRRVVALRHFEWEPRGDGVALRWATDPPVSPAGVAGYRVWRLPGGAPPRVAVGAALIADSALVDAGGRAGDAYELVAVSADGSEFPAGRLDLPAAPVAIRAWPQPAGEAARVRLSFAAPRSAGAIAADLDVSIYDTRGRRIRRLVFGRPETRAGVVEVEWDGRTQRGGAAGPGLYFVRVRAPSAGFESTRRLVMLEGAGR